MNVAAIILTFNEEQNLPDCLASLKGWTNEQLVVDSGSTDATPEIANSAGAQLVTHGFETHARQWNWVLENIPIRSEWILGIDADQRVTPELMRAIEAFVGSNPEAKGCYVARRQIFLGRWIRYGSYYPKFLLKLFRKGFVLADEKDLVDHHFRVKGSVVILQGDLIENNQKELDLSFWMEKHVRYAMLQAEEEERNHRSDHWPSKLMGHPDERIQSLKSIWVRMPLFIRPLIYFFYRYVLRLGFLDGIEGLIFHGFQAFWYRFLVDLRLDELRCYRIGRR